MKDTIIRLSVVYLIVSLLQLMMGVMNGGAEILRGTCDFTRKIDYVLPAYKVGCWLGEKK